MLFTNVSSSILFQYCIVHVYAYVYPYISSKVNFIIVIRFL